MAREELTTLRQRQNSASTDDLKRWADDPVVFAREVIGIECWGRQAELLRAMAGWKLDRNGKRVPIRKPGRVAIRSGHKISKSNTLAIFGLWWVTVKGPNARAICTAPTGRQVEKILWREVKAMARKSPLFPAPSVRADPGIRYADGREFFGFSTSDNKTADMGGFSSPHILFIVDEASGVSEDVYEAIFGNLAGGGTVILVGNPTSTAGTFYDAFHRNAEYWTCVHVSSEETPNVVEGRTVIAGLATRSYVEEMRKLWGEDSLSYQVRIAGNFPGQASDVAIGVDLVNAAQERWEDTEEGNVLDLGVDVAREGDDDSIIQPVRGKRALPLRPFNGLDGPELADEVIKLLIGPAKIRRGQERVRIRIDSVGVGASPYDSLVRKVRALDFSDLVTVTPVDAGEAAGDEQYQLVRDELWFGIRTWLEAGGAIPDDPRLEGDLTSRKYSFTDKNKICVEKKKDLKKRLRRSPDRGDALALAVFRTPRTSDGSKPRKPKPATRWSGFSSPRGF